MTDDGFVPPSLEDLLQTAEDAKNAHPADIDHYPEEIQETLRDLQDAIPYDDTVKAKLTELYEAWEEAEYPHQPVDDDSYDEGGPDDPEHDPDVYPDPEDAPKN